MKKLLICLLSLAAIPMMADQIKGRVTDQEGQPMPYVTISAYSADSTLITGAITDEQGNYEMDAPKNAILQASFVGYQTVSGGPDFQLSEENTQLAEIEVKAKKPLIERQLDKIVVNVGESPIAQGNSLTNVLKRAPGVHVDKDGNVTVNGKSVEVYIDGRPSYMSGEQLKGLLEGTDGGTVEKIEIITNPSAKYDAAGQGGIINIKLKKNKMQGLNGTLTAAYGGMYFKDALKPWQNMDYVSLNLNYRTAKTYTNVQLTQVYADIAQSMNIKTIAPDTTLEVKNEYTGDFQMYNLRVSNDFMIDSVNTFGFIFNAPFMKFSYDGQEATQRNYMPQHTANLNYTHVFNENLAREITANVDYTRNLYKGQNGILLERKSDGNRVDNNSRQAVDIASAKLDFQTMFWKTGMIEAGVKYAYSTTNNNMTTDSTIVGLNTQTGHNDFMYQEHVAAAYITAAKQFVQKVTLKLGLRGEYTYARGDWKSADTVNTYSYFNLFPTAYVGYTPNDKWNISATYTRRIKRPSYRELNPFRSYVDAHHYQAGNPQLNPEFNNDVQLNVAWSQYISINGIFSHTTDMFNMKTVVLPNGYAGYEAVNFGTCTTHGVQASFTEIPLVPKYMTLEDGSRMMQGAWLAMTVNAGYYNFINQSYDHTYRDQCNYWNIYGNLTAYLPKMWTITVDGQYTAPMTIGYDRGAGYYGMDFAIRKVIASKGIILNLSVQDLLRSSIWKSETKGLAEGYGAETYVNGRQQKVVFSLVYNFGKHEWHKQRKVGDADSSSRLSGGNSIGGGMGGAQK